ncbi:MAG: riboflavin synthase subunit alpha [SAR86 cluster bacterium]|jgi:riboflavin synthase|nr:riboflavin synthase subunit alpha [SAR86 cluster bacterium]|tara:strand:+ start:225 stop:827 length:603 start_codon:yes stop_codon:yes gene_type:complete
MFTGIVQEIGIILEREETDSGISLTIATSESFLEKLTIGASIAVNGVCLTVVEFFGDSVRFDVIPETLRVTNLNKVTKDSRVNLERSLKFGDEVGGHVLSGHISCTASSRLVKSDDEVELILSCPKEWMNYIFHKGYVAVNGASLTVAKKESDNFSVFLIPETLKATNLHEVLVEDLLNIEVDQTTYAAVKATEARLLDV